MQTRFEHLKAHLIKESYIWLVTGVAGFIGSNLLETLLKLNQRVIGLDNLSTGYQRNLDEVRALVTDAQWQNFFFMQGDIRSLEDCKRAMLFPASKLHGQEVNDVAIDFVLHQAALGSVPRSLADPLATNATNVSGFLNMLVAARDANVKSFTYAASSSTYGDHPGLPKVEDTIGKPLSPYAVTKYVNELYAEVFDRCYNFKTIGLRYFNVFGPRQDPDGAYAAVIPKWIISIAKGEPIYINGDGETSRDFCFIENTVQANLLAATAYDSLNQPRPESIGGISPLNQIYNIAVGESTSLNDLCAQIQSSLRLMSPQLQAVQTIHRDFRAGDVQHSLADISKAQQLLGYTPTHNIRQGLEMAMPWYLRRI